MDGQRDGRTEGWSRRVQQRTASAVVAGTPGDVPAAAAGAAWMQGETAVGTWPSGGRGAGVAGEEPERRGNSGSQPASFSARI